MNWRHDHWVNQPRISWSSVYLRQIGRDLIAWGLFSLCTGVGRPDDCYGGEGFGPHDRARGVVAGRSPHGMMPLGHLQANQGEDVVGRACRRECLGLRGREQLATRGSGATIHAAQA
jgi:hypothetical protein